MDSTKQNIEELGLSVVEHILIRDAQTKEEIVNRREIAYTQNVASKERNEERKQS
jgi:hypothetical protein